MEKLKKLIETDIYIYIYTYVHAYIYIYIYIYICKQVIYSKDTHTRISWNVIIYIIGLFKKLYYALRLLKRSTSFKHII